MRHQRDEVGLGTAGHKQAGLEAQLVCEPFLQRIDGRVISVDIVADLRAQHGFTHSCRRLRDGVAA